MWDLANAKTVDANNGINRQNVYDYYSNDFITEQIMKFAKGREIAGRFWNGTYDKRPNILQYPADIIQMARNGVTSFHLSVEHWTNPMALVTEKENYDKLRAGWDFIIDIDSKLGMNESRIAAEFVCRLLRKYGIKHYGIKFSGSRGFHVSVPWSMFPKSVDYKKTSDMYPELPRILARFVRKKIRQKLMSELIKSKGAKNLIDMLGEVPEKLNPFYFVDVEKDWGNRHMFRAPYSFNEKTWFVSLPLSFAQLKNFSPDMAKPENAIKGHHEDFFKDGSDEAADFLTEAMDWYSTVKKREPKKEKKVIVVWEGKITQEFFPPCIKNILNGLADGRKRSVFTLVNFLRMMNWPWEEIEHKVYEWNEKNKPPLPRAIMLGQLRWSQRNARNPSNCPPDGSMFYGDTVNVCRPDAVCTKGTKNIMIKNPIVYPFKLMKKTQKKIYRGYSCGICGKEMKNMRSLEMHKSRMHDTE